MTADIQNDKDYEQDSYYGKNGECYNNIEIINHVIDLLFFPKYSAAKSQALLDI